jgi:YgiT-type zinc finger domain-containing protein
MIKKITHCPSCGSAKIKRVRRKWSGQCRGRPYSVNSLEYHECPDCGEKVYSPQAMRAIEAVSPAFNKSASK